MWSASFSSSRAVEEWSLTAIQNPSQLNNTPLIFFESSEISFQINLLNQLMGVDTVDMGN